MDTKKPAVRTIIFRVLCLVILIAGLKVGCASGDEKPLAISDYQKQMIALAADFGKLEKEGQDAVQKNGKDAAGILSGLQAMHAKKEADVQKLKSLTPPEKYKELHESLIEWKSREFDNETKMLDGMRRYAMGQSKEVESEMDALSKESDDIMKLYDAKTQAIAKKNGFNTVDQFLSAK